MVDRIRKWWAALVAAVIAIGGLAFVLLAESRKKAVDKHKRKAAEYTGRRDYASEQAAQEKRRVADSIVAAAEAEAKAKETIERLRSEGHETLADHVDAYNRRLRNRSRPGSG